MTSITKNIWRHELACSCGCGFDTMDYVTISVVQDVCDHFATKLGVEKVVLTITSAARCYEWNRTPVHEGGPGSNDDSQHPKGKAMDIKIKGVKPREIYDYLCEKYPNQYGIGLYSTFVHFDSRDWCARW